VIRFERGGHAVAAAAHFHESIPDFQPEKILCSHPDYDW